MEHEGAEESSCPGATGTWNPVSLDTHESEQSTLSWAGSKRDRAGTASETIGDTLTTSSLGVLPHHSHFILPPSCSRQLSPSTHICQGPKLSRWHQQIPEPSASGAQVDMQAVIPANCPRVFVTSSTVILENLVDIDRTYGTRM